MSADNWTQCPKRLEDPSHSDDTIFREDYEIYGAEKGTVSVDYSGYCRECHLSINFDYKKVISLV